MLQSKQTSLYKRKLCDIKGPKFDHGIQLSDSCFLLDALLQGQLQPRSIQKRALSFLHDAHEDFPNNPVADKKMDLKK
jgi:hypothetical protein